MLARPVVTLSGASSRADCVAEWAFWGSGEEMNWHGTGCLVIAGALRVRRGWMTRGSWRRDDSGFVQPPKSLTSGAATLIAGLVFIVVGGMSALNLLN